MTKKTNTLIVPRQIQMLTTILFVGAFILILFSQGLSIANLMQYGGDMMPTLRFLMTDTLIPMFLFVAIFFLLPKLPFLGRLFYTALLSVLGFMLANFVAGLVSLMYTQATFAHVTAESLSLDTYNLITNTLHYSILGVGYVVFLGLIFYWRKQKIWD